MSTPAGGRMAFEAIAAVIMSVSDAHLEQLATMLTDFTSRANTLGGQLADSAAEVGAQTGEPYQVYADRLRPVGEWVGTTSPPAQDISVSLQQAADATKIAREQLVISRNSLEFQRNDLQHNAGYGPNPVNAADAMDQAHAKEAARLQPYVDDMEAAFGTVTPQPVGAAPVNGTTDGGAGAAGAAPLMAGGAAAGGSAGANGAAPNDAGAEGATPAGLAPDGSAAGAEGLAPVPGAGGMVPAAGVGPQSGAFDGWVQSPSTGNLVDPATGREVNSGGQFLDPVTGQPFGDASTYASRLAGIEGGGGGGFVPTVAGLPSGGFESLRGGAAGGVPPVAGGGLAPVPTGGGGAFGGGAFGGGGYGAGIAGMYGGVIPPSLAGASPVGGQLRERAAENMAQRARWAQGYASASAQANGHAQGYVPPMGGAGAGAGMGGAGGRSPRGRGLLKETGSVWGATGRGVSRHDERRQPARRTTVEEDADVWTSGRGADTASPLLGDR